MRELLARRGVMGSSFANDAETRTRIATGQEEERAGAEAAVQEIGLSRQIITDQITNELTRYGAEMGLAQEDRAILGQQAQVIAQRASTVANQMDRELNELGVAAQFRTQLNQMITSQAMDMARLDMLSQTTNAQFQQQSALANAGFIQNANLASAGARVDASMANAKVDMGLSGLMLSAFPFEGGLTNQINSGLRSGFGGLFGTQVQPRANGMLGSI